MPITDRDPTLLTGSYADLASEYYDPRRHPTCANFREASQLLLTPWLCDLTNDRVDVLETGAGASIVCEWLVDTRRRIGRLVVTDVSKEMLRYSRGSTICSHLIVCDAQQLPLISSGFDLVVASLGDPYNSVPFWSEVARVLRPGGHVLFTTPSFEWALQFRGGSHKAEFILSNGQAITVPSDILSNDAQRRLVEGCEMALVEIRVIQDSELHRTPRSPKLRKGPIVTGYLCRRLSNVKEVKEGS